MKHYWNLPETTARLSEGAQRQKARQNNTKPGKVKAVLKQDLLC